MTAHWFGVTVTLPEANFIPFVVFLFPNVCFITWLTSLLYTQFQLCNIALDSGWPSLGYICQFLSKIIIVESAWYQTGV
jgi:hypothetical protein